MKFYLILISFILIGCGGSSSNEAPKKIENFPPVLAFEPTYSVNEQTAIELTVVATDDKTIASYAWQQVSGKPVTLSNTNSSKLSFITPTVLITEGEQTLEFEVIVTDNEGLSSFGKIVVTVAPVNSAPQLTYEPSYSFNEQTAVQVSVNATDDNAISSYAWQQISGTAVTLSNTNSSKLSFNAPIVLMAEGIQQLVFEVVVTDNEGATSKASFEVNISPVNTAPALTFESSYSVNEQTDTVLFVSASDDSAAISYLWEQKSGIPVSLNDINTRNLNFITPISLMNEAATVLEFKVSVTDSEGLLTSGVIVVNVQPINILPEVAIVAPKTVNSLDNITVTAEAVDRDGGILNYSWQQVSGPEVVINNAFQASISLNMPNVHDNQTITLKVSVEDNEGGVTVTEADIYITPKLVHQTVDLIKTKSGAYTQIEWQFIDGVAPYEVSLVQVTGSSYPIITMLDNNKAYFNAPVEEVADAEMIFELTVIDSNNQGASQNIKVSVSKAIKKFADSKPILEFDASGAPIKAFDIADMDNDGISDVIAHQSNGTYWYKNLGGHNIDMIPKFIRGEINYAKPYELKVDLTDDGLLDLITLQRVSGYFQLNLLVNNGAGEFTSTQKIGDLLEDNRNWFDVTNVFTFDSDNNSYVIAQTLDNDDITNIFMFKKEHDGFSLVNNTQYSGTINVLSCDITTAGAPTLFYEALDKTDNSLDGKIYALSASDAYQKPKLIHQYSLEEREYTALACLEESNNGNRLIHYIDTATPKTFEIKYDQTAGLYTYHQFDSVMTQKSIYAYERFYSDDINHDGLDDLVLLRTCYSNDDCINLGEVKQVYIRSNSESLDFELISEMSTLEHYAYTYWQETNEYRLFKKENNTLLLTPHINNLSSGAPNDVIHFKDPLRIHSVSYFDDRFIVGAWTASGNLKYKYYTMKDQALVEDLEFNLDLFKGQIPKLAALNNDGYLDAVYDYTNNSKTRIVSRMGNEQGYEYEKIILEGNVNQAFLNRIIDVNNDGYLDIESAQEWYLYQEKTDTYEHVTDLYDAQNSSSSVFYRRKNFIDLNNDNLLDILSLDNYTNNCEVRDCGYLQLSIADKNSEFLVGKIIENDLLGLQNIMFHDVDLNGTKDIIVEAYAPDEDIWPYYWYQLQADGSFKRYEYKQGRSYKEYLSWFYKDLNGTGQAYFFDFKGEHLNYYKYNLDLKRPVIIETQLTPKVFMDYIGLPRYDLIDVDKDKDLDVIQHDDHNIYLIENLH